MRRKEWCRWKKKILCADRGREEEKEEVYKEDLEVRDEEEEKEENGRENEENARQEVMRNSERSECWIKKGKVRLEE